MSNPNKRRRFGNSDPPEDSDAERLVKIFDKVEPLLCELVAVSRSVADLSAVLGEKRSNFVEALQSMAWAEENKIPPRESFGRIVRQRSAKSLGKLPAKVEGAAGFSTAPQSIPTPGGVFIPFIRNSAVTRQPWPPPLPQIANARIRADAFSPGPSHHNFQRMEFLGDSYLQMISSHLLYEQFPHSREGPLSDMRSELVANLPLSEYAQLYNFPSLINDTGWKALADSFEAYVGGVVLSDPIGGTERLKEWLAALYEPKMREMETQQKTGGIRFTVRSRMKKIHQSKVEKRHSRNAGRNSTRARVLRSRPPAPQPIARAGPEEEEWEEWDDAMMLEEGEIPEVAIVPINKGAKNSVNFLISGDGAVVKYTPIEGDENGFEIVAFLTGWGFHDHPIGQGWGVSEE